MTHWILTEFSSFRVCIQWSATLTQESIFEQFRHKPASFCTAFLGFWYSNRLDLAVLIRNVLRTAPQKYEKAAFGRLKHTLAAAFGYHQRVLSHIFEVLFEKYFWSQRPNRIDLRVKKQKMPCRMTLACGEIVQKWTLASLLPTTVPLSLISATHRLHVFSACHDIRSKRCGACSVRRCDRIQQPYILGSRRTYLREVTKSRQNG